ncbi:MAG: glycosyltransferase family 4 protein [Anaerolineales bacterium]
MRVLIVHMRYRPDATGTGPLVTALAEGLASRGEEVTVITSAPHYGRQSIPAQYRGGWLRKHQEAGVDVLRTAAFPWWSGTVVGRAIDYGTYTALGILAVLRLGRPDVTLAVAPPITVGIIGWLIRRFRGAPLVYVAQDIWPDGLVQMGKLTSPPLISIFRALERWIYRTAAHVVVVSDGMKRNLQTKGVPPNKVSVIANWVDLDKVQPVSKENAFRSSHCLSEKFVVLFAGNLGFSSALDTVLRAAQELREHPDIVFVIVGEGSAKPGLVSSKEELGLENVMFLPTQPEKHLSAMMGAADISLVTLRDGMGTLSVPSKTYTIMASGRPILAAVPADSAVRDLVEESGAGRVTVAEDPGVLAKAILAMKEDIETLEQMGARGRHYAEAHFGRDMAVQRYHSLLRDVAK